MSTLAAVADALYLWADADSPAAKQLGPEASVILAFLYAAVQIATEIGTFQLVCRQRRQRGRTNLAVSFAQHSGAVRAAFKLALKGAEAGQTLIGGVLLMRHSALVVSLSSVSILGVAYGGVAVVGYTAAVHIGSYAMKSVTAGLRRLKDNLVVSRRACLMLILRLLWGIWAHMLGLNNMPLPPPPTMLLVILLSWKLTIQRLQAMHAKGAYKIVHESTLQSVTVHIDYACLRAVRHSHRGILACSLGQALTRLQRL